jgi:hypothetical protein
LIGVVLAVVMYCALYHCQVSRLAVGRKVATASRPGAGGRG